MENMAKKFAQAVLSRRKYLGLTQDELAKRVGTSKQMVSKYELGQRSPKVTMANAFAEALDTTLDELLGVDKADAESLFVEEVQEDPEIRIVTDMMKKMTKEQKQQVIDIIRVVLRNQPDIIK